MVKKNDRRANYIYMYCNTKTSILRYTVPSNQKLLLLIVHHNNTRFKANKEGIMDAFVLHLRKKKGAGGAGGSKCQRVSPGDAALGYALC